MVARRRQAPRKTRGSGSSTSTASSGSDAESTGSGCMTDGCRRQPSSRHSRRCASTARSSTALGASYGLSAIISGESLTDGGEEEDEWANRRLLRNAPKPDCAEVQRRSSAVEPGVLDQILERVTFLEHQLERWRSVIQSCDDRLRAIELRQRGSQDLTSCSECRCASNGTLFCSAIGCSQLTCAHPVLRQGDSCPTSANEQSNLLAIGNGSWGGNSVRIRRSALDISVCAQQQPKSVTRVVIENMLYPVMLDVIHQMFPRYGKVLRNITFSRNSFAEAINATRFGVSPFLTGLTTCLADSVDGRPAVTNAAILNATAAAPCFTHVGIMNTSAIPESTLGENVAEPFNTVFVSKFSQVPLLALLLERPRCGVVDKIPKLKVCSGPAEFSYLIRSSNNHNIQRLTDGCGTWRSSGVYAVTGRYNVNEYGKRAAGETGIVLKKYYSVHSHTRPAKVLRRCVWSIECGGTISGHILVSYDVSSSLQFVDE